MNNGGAAFPSHGTMGEVAQEGMSLRDYFAAAALQSIRPLHSPQIRQNPGEIAEYAYDLADAMLAAREGRA